MADYNKRSVDISSLLPVRLRDRTLSAIIKNLFNRYLTKSEVAPFYGYVGSTALAIDSDVYIAQPTLDRELNALMPALYVKQGTTQRAFTWNDVLQKLLILGVDIDKLATWGAVKSFNWVPPIDLDKFINFSEYYWIGGWVKQAIEFIRADIDVLVGVGNTTAGLENKLSMITVSPAYFTTATADETWTILFTSSSTFTVTGSLAGVSTPGTVNASGDTAYIGGILSFKLAPGPYVTGNKIVFRTHDFSNFFASVFYNADASLNLLNNKYTLALESEFTSANPTYKPDYYVIKRKANNDLVGWTAWSTQNLWVHKSDVETYVNSNLSLALDRSTLVQANRPIIEYDNDIQLNAFVNASGAPAGAGTPYTQEKAGANQPPLFDLYYLNEAHANKISPLFYYAEGNNYPVDTALGRRLQVDSFGEFTFEQGLIIDDDSDSDAADVDTDQQLLYYKKNNVLTSIWVDGYVAVPKYEKFDETGTFINEDKLRNYKNYYWVGLLADLSLYPSYYGTNKGQPEYTVIEAGGTSDWSKFNYWAHVTDLNQSQLSLFIQAQRPIIEFNKVFETELITAKVAFDERPHFVLYSFNDVLDTYETIPTAGLPADTDIVGQHYLFAPMSAYPQIAQDGNVRVGEVAGTLVTVDDTQYVQSLLTYYFLPNGNPTFSGVGNGTMTPSIKSTGGVQEWWVVCSPSNPLSFTVTGSVSGLDPTQAIVGALYDNGAISFTITAGGVPFQAGDFFNFKFISSYQYDVQHFVKFDNLYKSITTPIDIVDGVTERVVVPATPSLNDGAWKVPEPIFFNLNNENRRQLKQGDLYYHFGSIIQAQPGLVGGALSTNNYRTLAADHGLGGRIKQFNDSWNLFIGMMCQQNITPLSLLEFAKEQYANLQAQIIEYGLTQGVDDLTAGIVNISDPTNIEKLFTSFTEYINAQNAVVVASPSTVDDHIAQLFYDSNSPIPNAVIALVQLGLVNRVLPTVTFDPLLGITMLTHHDGHRTQDYVYTLDTIKKYVNKSYTRSNGQISAGFVTANITPEKPFKNQYWFNTVGNQLKYYNVVSDTGEEPVGMFTGAYSYNRIADTLKRFNGVSWVNHVSLSDPWILVPNMISALSLRVEQKLYNKVPPTSLRVPVATYEADPSYLPLLEKQFEKFGQRHGIDDIYSPHYEPTNPFSWNYSGIVVSPLVQAYATWQGLYTAYYGTARPDMYPWITTGQTQAAFLAELAFYAITPFTSAMWSFVKAKIGGKPLSVDGITNALLPPFLPLSDINAAEALINSQPVGIANRFVFGDNGSAELTWKASIDYNYDRAKVYFKLDPINFVYQTWGYYHLTVGSSAYQVYREQNKKLSQVEFKLHGEARADVSDNGFFDSVVAPPLVTATYEVEVVNRLDSYYKVTNQLTGVYAFNQVGPFTPFLDATNGVQFRLRNANRKGVKQGDKWTLTFTNGSLTRVFTPITTYSFTGFNQLYVQLLRHESSSLDTALNVSILRAWQALLCYRVAGFVNTSNLTILDDGFDLSHIGDDYNILVKENRYLTNNWLHGLRVQLVQIGSNENVNGFMVPAKAPGDSDNLRGKDWIFRLENFNPKVPNLNFHALNTAGNYVTFKALDGVRTLNIDWKRYTDVASTETEAAPFLITGVQNLVNFIFGYVSKLTSDGWSFIDSENPLIDQETGRLVDWQLEVERFLNSIFSSPAAGSGFIFCPFKKQVFFNTPRGVVADLTQRSKYDIDSTQAIMNINGHEINPAKVRVFRGDDTTEIISDEPMYTLHLSTSEYEHIILFNNYAADVNLIYDAFLGQRVNRIIFDGEKQVTFNGRLSFGGEYLEDNVMKHNIESSIEGILKYYDAELIVAGDEAERASALIGYEEKSYFKDLNIPLKSSFKFWQGLIKNKGSNFSIDAFINSNHYDRASLDEYWAYKLADYGDSRLKQDPEMRIFLTDLAQEQSRYRFIEQDEIVPSALDNDGYDVPTFDGSYDGTNLGDDYLVEDGNPDGFNLIYSDDASRWVTIDDFYQHQYFVSDRFTSMVFVPTSTEALYDIVSADGTPVFADSFDVIDLTDPARTRYWEKGQLQSDGTYSTPAFERINGWTVRINDANLLGHSLRVRCFGRPTERYGPFRVINYRDNVTSNDGIFPWDPQKGRHQPTAYKEVDFYSDENPARYNKTDLIVGTLQYDPARAWGDNQVGKIWWNIKDLAYRPYSDSKIHTLEERLTLWGALSDYSTINVSQWVASPVPPEQYLRYVQSQTTGDYKLTGEVAVKDLLVRGRKWQHRTVAWKYSSNPVTSRRWFVTSPTGRIKLSSTAIGNATAIFSAGRLSTLGLANGWKFCNAIFSTITKTGDAASITKVFGESLITSDEKFIIGSAAVYDDGGVFSQTTISDGYSEEYQDNLNQLDSGGKLALGQSFIGTGTTLAGATFSMRKEGMPPGDATAYIYLHDAGTFGSAGVPSGAAIATSEPVAVNDVLGFQSALVTFTFLGNNKITLIDGTKYVVVVSYNLGNNANHVRVGSDDSSPTHPGNASYLLGASWVPVAGSDLCFYLITELPEVFNNFKMTPDQNLLRNYLTDVTGAIVMDSEYDGDTEIYYLRATCTETGATQRLQVVDTPIKAGAIISYNFDELGLTISATTMFSHNVIWPGMTTLSNVPARQQAVAATFGNPNHSLYVRSTVNVFNLMPYTYTYTLFDNVETLETSELYTTTDQVELCWVGWQDPTDLTSDPSTPFNRWEPVYGDYQDIGDDLVSVESYIKAEVAAPLVTAKGQTIKKYGYIWSPWELSSASLRHAKYNVTNAQTATRFFETNFTLTLSTVSDIRPRVSVYVNGKQLQPNQWFFAKHTDVTIVNPVVTVTKQVNIGDMVTVRLDFYRPSEAELAFDPDTTEEEQPTQLLQYKYDYPHVIKESWNSYGNKEATTYYFWVKDLTSPYGNKQQAVKNIAQLLENNTDPYAIMTGLKWHDQRNGKPARFALLIIKNLGNYAQAADTYKLRLSANLGMRDDDRNLSLKNYHKEWTLIRERQSTRIPKQLWDIMINAAAGENALGDELPSYRRHLYDQQNDATTRYGFASDQIFVDRSIAIDTVEYTILNTKLDKYVPETNSYVPDSIDFSTLSPGYNDINSLSTYLSTPSGTRTLLNSIWESAKPKQVNEIFFAVLADAMTVNYELTDLFKTSLVALQATIPVQTSNLVNTIEYY